MATVTVELTSGTSWTTPGDWSAPWTIEVIGGGAGGARRASNTSTGAAAGGGGAYAAITNADATIGPNTLLYLSIGTGGAGATTAGGAGGSGTDTWVNLVSNAAPTSIAQGVLAKAGTGPIATIGGSGGTAVDSIGSTKYAGGAGGNGGTDRGGGGGGGAAGNRGPGGAGAAPTSSTGGGGGGGSGEGASGTGGGAGSVGTSVAGGDGGNNSTGTGQGLGVGSLNGQAGTNGGGGAGGGRTTAARAGGAGGNGTYWTDGVTPRGAGGGGGGGGQNTSASSGVGGAGAQGGLYGGGGGGGGGGSTTTAECGDGGNGRAGLIIITYTSIIVGTGNITEAADGLVATGNLRIQGAGTITESDDGGAGGSAYVAALDLDFTTGTLDSRVTFSRASIATRVNASGYIESVASGAPRFDYDPITLMPLGLLLERAGTNNFTYSEQFAQADWSKSAVTISSDASASPDNNVTADLIIEDSTSNVHRVSQAKTTTAAPWTSSVFAKASGRSWMRVLLEGTTFGSKGAFFDLANGVVGAVDAGITADIKPYKNGFYRLIVTATLAAESTRVYFQLATANSAGTPYLGDGLSGVFLWGAQFEAGGSATSYIQTTTAAVTRALDYLRVTGSNFSDWFNPLEGTIVVDYRISSTYSNNQRALTSFNQTASPTNNRIYSYLTGATAPAFYVVDAGSVATSASGSAAPLGLNRYAGAYRANDFALSTNGQPVIPDTTGSIPTVDRLEIGSWNTSSESLNGHIARVRYFNQRLPNALLQTFTKAITGAGSLTEANDNVVAGGRVRITGQAIITEGDDVATATGEVGIPLVTPSSRTAAVVASRLSNRTAR